MKTFIFLLLVSFNLWAQESHLNFKVSSEASSVLSIMGQEISGMDLKCGADSCQLTVDQAAQVGMDVDFIERPFVGGLMVVRIYGGTEKLLSSIYKSMGPFTSTNDFKGALDERKLGLDANMVKFRCTATRDENPVHECWILIHGSILI